MAMARAVFLIEKYVVVLDKTAKKAKQIQIYIYGFLHLQIKFVSQST